MFNCSLKCQLFSPILDALHDGVTIYDRSGNLIWLNDKACQITGMNLAPACSPYTARIEVLNAKGGNYGSFARAQEVGGAVAEKVEHRRGGGG